MLGAIVFVHGALALAKDVVDLAHINVAPDFSPFGIEVAAQRRAKGVSGRLIILLIEHGLGHSEVRQ